MGETLRQPGRSDCLPRLLRGGGGPGPLVVPHTLHTGQRGGGGGERGQGLLGPRPGVGVSSPASGTAGPPLLAPVTQEALGLGLKIKL